MSKNNVEAYSGQIKAGSGIVDSLVPAGETESNSLA